MTAACVDLARVMIISGHYGCGKTNLALNMAADFARRGERVTLVDMDVVNPYFRSSDYQPLLEKLGVELLAPVFAHSNVDLPAMPAEMASIFTRDGRIIIDAGGDDAGAVVLGRYAAQLDQLGCKMLYVVNKYRVLSTTVEQTVRLLREIETASRLRASVVVNNSHLMELTTVDSITASDGYAREVADTLGLPLAFTAVEKRFADKLPPELSPVYPLDILVTKPW